MMGTNSHCAGRPDSPYRPVDIRHMEQSTGQYSPGELFPEQPCRTRSATTLTAYDEPMAEEIGTGTVRRQQRAEVSRARILDAAVETLIESGYAGASTHEIQKRAGVSRGRLLHHFGSRDTLLVAAAQHLIGTRMDQLAHQLRAESGPPPESLERIDHAVDLMWRSFQQSYFWASIELWLAARHNDELGAALRPQERRLYQVIREVVDAAFGPAIVTSPHYRTVRELLLTSMRGVTMTYAFDPRDPAADAHVARWRHIAHTLLDPPHAPGP